MQGAQIVANIKTIAAKKGVKLLQLYNDCEISPAALSQWKTGKTSPSMPNLERIARYLEVSVSDLIGDKLPHSGLRLPTIHDAPPLSSGLRLPTIDKSPAPGEGEAEFGLSKDVIQFLSSVPQDRMRGILLALGAPEAILASLDRQEPPV